MTLSDSALAEPVAHGEGTLAGPEVYGEGTLAVAHRDGTWSNSHQVWLVWRRRGMNFPVGNTASLERALSAALQGEVRFDRISRALYSTDASVYQIMPLGVVIPRSREDVVHTLNLCREHGVSITARGGGTSQAGQAIGSGVQLDFSKYLNRLLEFSPGARWVRVEPGIVLDALNAQLKPYGLQVPLDISTSDRATIGGMIANNSSGTRSVVYGKTIDYVEAITAVLADGTIAELAAVDDAALERKCTQPDLEGGCYRVVRRLAAEHAREIDRRFPKILRRVGGYNLDLFLPAQPFNLARLIVGSEGTLALVLDAKLRLVPLPGARGLCVVQFQSLLEALEATPVILEHRPSAVELLDRYILASTRGRTEFEPLRDFITGDPAAVLIVECLAESAAALPPRIQRIESALRGRGLGYHFHHALEPAAQARVWRLRRAALGLSMSERGDAKAISFVEDTAVAPERLRDYIARFLSVLERHQTEAGFYAHASVGLLHVRPVVNLKAAEGVEKFERIAHEIAELVLEFGGALSGEHGDGLVRSPFQQQIYGPALYRAFCEIKQTFDPPGIFNPGKIVHAAPLTRNLRFGATYVTQDPETAFDFSDFGGMGRAAEQCGGVGECRKRFSGTMCPSYMATRDEADSTRGRANVLRLALSGRLGGDGLRDPALYPVLDLCLECKACKAECPTGVDMARLKSEFLYQFQQAHGAPLRTRLLAQPNQLARWASRGAWLSNWLLRRRLSRWLLDRWLGLDRRRLLPPLARAPFLTWWSDPRVRPALSSRHETARVALFVDTFSNYYEPEIPRAVMHLAHQAGIAIATAPQVCCGRPLISKGFLDQARVQAEACVRALHELAGQRSALVFCEPSCYSAVRDDHPHLVRGATKRQALEVAEMCETFEEWALRTLVASWGSLPPSELQVLLHGHCHQSALGVLAPAVRLLRTILGCHVSELDSGCCGMAGSFGYEREHYELSRLVGESRLFPAVRNRPAGAIVVASGFSCRHQIEHFTGVRAVHPAYLLCSRLQSVRQGTSEHHRRHGKKEQPS